VSAIFHPTQFFHRLGFRSTQPIAIPNDVEEECSVVGHLVEHDECLEEVQRLRGRNIVGEGGWRRRAVVMRRAWSLATWRMEQGVDHVHFVCILSSRGATSPKVTISACTTISLQTNTISDKFIPHIHPSIETSGGINLSLVIRMIPSHPSLMFNQTHA
jgi:hypothetical protein